MNILKENNVRNHKHMIIKKSKNLVRLGENFYTYELISSIAKFLLDRISIAPKIGIICGSGMGSIADSVQNREIFPYESIPHFPISTVPGHEGRLVFGTLDGVPVMCMQGRFHYYEGYPLWKCTMPIRVMKLMGVTHLIATNAAGGLNPDFETGDVMIIKDHINLMGFSGNNPLLGVNEERFGPRFPPMNRAYDKKLRKAAYEIAKDLNMNSIIKEGVYSVIGGPNFETVAELRMLRTCGVDAVGMSTVHEVITAHHCGMTVAAISLITNKCVMEYDDNNEANHEEVMETGNLRGPLVGQLVSKLVGWIGENQSNTETK